MCVPCVLYRAQGFLFMAFFAGAVLFGLRIVCPSDNLEKL